jgi:hypothetical protein
MSFRIETATLIQAIKDSNAFNAEGKLQLEAITKKVRDLAGVKDNISDYEIIKEIAKKLTEKEFSKNKDEKTTLFKAFQAWSGMSKASHATRVSVRIAGRELRLSNADLNHSDLGIWLREFFSITRKTTPKGSEDEITQLTQLESQLIDKISAYAEHKDQRKTIREFVFGHDLQQGIIDAKSERLKKFATEISGIKSHIEQFFKRIDDQEEEEERIRAEQKAASEKVTKFTQENAQIATRYAENNSEQRMAIRQKFDAQFQQINDQTIKFEAPHTALAAFKKQVDEAMAAADKETAGLEKLESDLKKLHIAAQEKVKEYKGKHEDSSEIRRVWQQTFFQQTFQKFAEDATKLPKAKGILKRSEALKQHTQEAFDKVDKQLEEEQLAQKAGEEELRQQHAQENARAQPMIPAQVKIAQTLASSSLHTKGLERRSVRAPIDLKKDEDVDKDTLKSEREQRAAKIALSRGLAKPPADQPEAVHTSKKPQATKKLTFMRRPQGTSGRRKPTKEGREPSKAKVPKAPAEMPLEEKKATLRKQKQILRDIKLSKIIQLRAFETRKDFTTILQEKQLQMELPVTLGNRWTLALRQAEQATKAGKSKRAENILEEERAYKKNALKIQGQESQEDLIERAYQWNLANLASGFIHTSVSSLRKGIGDEALKKLLSNTITIQDLLYLVFKHPLSLTACLRKVKQDEAEILAKLEGTQANPEEVAKDIARIDVEYAVLRFMIEILDGQWR